MPITGRMDDFAPRHRVLAVAAALILAALVPAAAAASGLPLQAAPEAHTHGPDGRNLDRRGLAAAEPYDVDAHAPWSASQYDGRALTADAADRTTLPTVHAIYVYPSDGANRFAQFAAMFQADAVQANELLKTTYNRGVRWDYRNGDCYSTPTTPCLDITVFKSRNTTRQFAGSAFSTVKKEVDRYFTNPNQKYVVWLDAAYTKACGQGNLYQDTRRTAANYNNNGRTLSVVYKAYPNDALTGGFCRGRVLLHEMGHNMGAVQSVAPHAFDGAHCNDSNEDVMCYQNDSLPNAGDTGNAVFDWGTDDYWDPIANPNAVENPSLATGDRLPWWTVNLSKYICPTGGDCNQQNSPEF